MKNFKFLSLVLLFTLISCGKEQFGSTPTSSSDQANGVQSYEKLACASSTLVKPAVDILYVVDNSKSTIYIENSIKSSIQQTIDKISKEFDYRVIGTPLISTSMTDFQVLASNPDTVPTEYSGNKISSSSAFNFFQPASGQEKGFSRVYSFADYHKNGILRQNAHTIVVLISNGTDSEVSPIDPMTGLPTYSSSIFSSKKTQLLNLKAILGSIQFRFMSIVAHKSTPAGCSVPGSTSGLVYKNMSNDIYDHPQTTGDDNPGYKDSYDLCASDGFSALFTGINSSINQVLLAHTYNYWPVTISSGSLDPSKLQVFKQSGTSSVQLVRGTDWEYEPSYSGPTRILPTPGEPHSGKAIRFLGADKYITYPACVVIKAADYTEYFQFIVLPRAPIPSSIAVRVNGQNLPSSAWSYQDVGHQGPINIKVAFNGTSTCAEGTPNCAPATPAVMKSGYMIKLNSPNFYQSGDNVEVYYLPAGI